MASTRNINTLGDYSLQQSGNNYVFNNGIDINRIYSQNFYPGNGLLPAAYPLNITCTNQINIESELFGIGSTNLINPKINKETPNFTNIQHIDFTKRLPIYLPEPIIVNTNERPFKSV
jgi:hypothetical protein